MKTKEKPLSVKDNPYLDMYNKKLVLVPEGEQYFDSNFHSRYLVYSDGERYNNISASRLLKPAGLRVNRKGLVVTSTLPLDWQKKVRAFEKAKRLIASDTMSDRYNE